MLTYRSLARSHERDDRQEEHDRHGAEQNVDMRQRRSPPGDLSSPVRRFHWQTPAESGTDLLTGKLSWPGIFGGRQSSPRLRVRSSAPCGGVERIAPVLFATRNHCTFRAKRAGGFVESPGKNRNAYKTRLFHLSRGGFGRLAGWSVYADTGAIRSSALVASDQGWSESLHPLPPCGLLQFQPQPVPRASPALGRNAQAPCSAWRTRSGLTPSTRSTWPTRSGSTNRSLPSRDFLSRAMIARS